MAIEDWVDLLNSGAATAVVGIAGTVVGGLASGIPEWIKSRREGSVERERLRFELETAAATRAAEISSSLREPYFILLQTSDRAIAAFIGYIRQRRGAQDSDEYLDPWANNFNNEYEAFTYQFESKVLDIPGSAFSKIEELDAFLDQAAEMIRQRKGVVLWQLDELHAKTKEARLTMRTAFINR